jgi:hypothetical protein
MIIDILIVLLIFVALGSFFYLSVNYKSKSDKAQEEQMRQSLAEEYIIDPETGAKLTLEQAESGHWVAHDNEFRELPEEDISKLAYEDQQIAERGLNRLRSNKNFHKRDHFEIDDFDVLEQCITLSHYDDWSFSNLFSFENGFIFSPAPETNSDIIQTESQLMMWLRISFIDGHYYFREKTKTEAFFDKLRSDDELKFDNYECFAFKTSSQILHVKRIIDILVEFKGLEIELKDDNLFIKSLRLINKDDVIKFEKILSTLQHIIKPFY